MKDMTMAASAAKLDASDSDALNATEMCYFTDPESDYEDLNRQYSKTLSDYMLYLLVMRPALMKSAVAIDAQKRFHIMFEHVEHLMQLDVKGCKRSRIESSQINDKPKRWEMVGKVWVEMLRFGAIHCTGRSHSQPLSKGGELITLVSLLNAHFGLGWQFSISKL
ncbi:uncharacterized protein LOC132309378 [Cornus florida]|uniref:uncharacterized protein LOC132309378 n=1 Tax=Cornus florida TaxID=4283 RepID=UPI002899C49E|nr:uncharacterized protein LOC132309378 [Cornus florida]